MDEVNRIKKILSNKGFFTGVHIRSQDPCMAELVANVGYDVVWIENEHAFLDKCATNLHVMAAQAGGAAAIVRVPWNDPVLVKPILEMGVDGVVFPMVSSAQEAKKAVASCTYPPRGVRGMGPIRANRYGLISNEEYLRDADRKIFKMIQVEQREAAENIEEILDVEGVDGIIVGQFDMSGSIGKLSRIYDPENLRLIETVFKACRKRRIPCGISAAPNEQDVNTWLAMGIDFVFMTNEYEWVRLGSQQALKMIHNLREGL